MNDIKQRLTLKVSREEIKRLKKLAIDSGKTLSDFIVHETSYFEFGFTDFCRLRIDKISPVRQGTEIIRIDIMFFELGSERVLRALWYELWTSQEYVEDKLQITHSPTDRDYADFGFRFIVDRYRENGSKLPPEYGAFVTKKTGTKLVKNRNELWNFYDLLLEKS